MRDAMVVIGRGWLRAADAPDDEKPVPKGQIKDTGTRVAVPAIAAASDEAAQASSDLRWSSRR